MFYTTTFLQNSPTFQAQYSCSKKTCVFLEQNLLYLIAIAWLNLCIIYEAKSLRNILLLKHKFFTIKIKEEEHMLTYINKAKALADQLKVAEV